MPTIRSDTWENNRYRFEKEVFPEIISIGDCINVHNCKATNVDLADGWCVNCWDKGEDAKQRIKINTEKIIADTKADTKRREEIKELESVIKESKRKLQILRPRGRHMKDCICEYHTKKGFE